MNLLEHAAKPLLAAAGIPVPEGRVVRDPGAAERAAAELGGRVAVKAQVPAGKRGKAGGIRVAATPAEARAAAEAILALEIGGHRVGTLLVERAADIEAELYCAVLNDPATRGPLVMVSTAGGMDIEEVSARHPERLRRAPVDIRAGLDAAAATALVGDLAAEAGIAPEALGGVLARLYGAYRAHDAELLEVNPLAVVAGGALCALDCKLIVDDSAAPRQAELAALAVPEPLTGLERRGRELGLKYIELDGDVGLLANGAGLTMTTMDVIAHHGGRAANFLEIGGDAYTKATPALELVLANPRVRSLVVNFCGAFARTDVMTGGVIEAWETLRPPVPAFYSVHGTGAAEAVAMLRERLGVEPHRTMDEAIAAAVAAARAEAGP